VFLFPETLFDHTCCLALLPDPPFSTIFFVSPFGVLLFISKSLVIGRTQFFEPAAGLSAWFSSSQLPALFGVPALPANCIPFLPPLLPPCLNPPFPYRYFPSTSLPHMLQSLFFTPPFSSDHLFLFSLRETFLAVFEIDFAPPFG